jgi:hypothetical protein
MSAARAAAANTKNKAATEHKQDLPESDRDLRDFVFTVAFINLIL